MMCSRKAALILGVAQLSLAAGLAACASLVGVQDGVLEHEAGQDGTTEAAAAETGADAQADSSTDATTPGDAALDSTTAPDSAEAIDTGEVIDAGHDAAGDAGDAGDAGTSPEEASTDGSTDAPLDAGTCQSRVPSTTTGVFVAPGGTDGVHCGDLPAAPCATVQAGLNSALNQGRTIVYVAAGAYTESISLYANVTVEGGWSYSGGAWTPVCPGPDAGTASQAVVITAPTSSNVTVSAIDLGGHRHALHADPREHGPRGRCRRESRSTASWPRVRAPCWYSTTSWRRSPPVGPAAAGRGARRPPTPPGPAHPARGRWAAPVRPGRDPTEEPSRPAVTCPELEAPATPARPEATASRAAAVSAPPA